ncbi:MAG: class I SAM-dependent methyltransferase [Chloroflexota bacterium]|nr:MAG: class I SAM-dependent methyltransferase [Chloroflexota bacterium]
MTDNRNMWREFFDDHAPHYMDNSFTKNTEAEAAFLLEELGLPVGSRILDVGCGTGRHAIELARQGYRVTGVDISGGMLAEAAKAATAAGVSVEWVMADATQFKPHERFDATICLCEGAFGLVGNGEDPEEHDRLILHNINAAMPIGGRLVMTTLNGYAGIRHHTQVDIESGRFDPVTMVEHVKEEWDLPEGKKSIAYQERRYTPPELVRLFEQVGFQVEHIWGGTAGNWGRRPIDLDEIEVMIVARKSRELTGDKIVVSDPTA